MHHIARTQWGTMKVGIKSHASTRGRDRKASNDLFDGGRNKFWSFDELAAMRRMLGKEV
jgi:hypothetical protein